MLSPPQKETMKIKILKNFIGRIDGKSVELHLDQVIDIDKEDADHMLRGGYAEKAAVKVIEKPEIKKSVKIHKEE